MINLTKAFIVFIILSFATTTYGINIKCGGTYLEQPVQDLAPLLFEQNFANLPWFLQDWLATDVDKNKNGIAELEEISMATCDLSRSIHKAVDTPSSQLVNTSGMVYYPAVWANDEEITDGGELALALGWVAHGWVKDKLVKNLTGDSALKTEALLQSGYFTVTKEDVLTQLDVAGEDGSRLGLFSKSRDLAYSLSQAKALIPPDRWNQVVQVLFDQLNQIKIFPLVTNIKEENGKLVIDTIINKVDAGLVGVDGVKRYYVQYGIGLQFLIDNNGVVQKNWGQAKDQIWTLLRDPESMGINTEKFVGKVSKTLQLECDDPLINHIRSLSPETIADRVKLESWMQQIFANFAEKFWQDEPTLILDDSLPSHGYAAYASQAQQNITISYAQIGALYENLQKMYPQQSAFEMLRSSILQDVAHEWTHLLQHGQLPYENNLLFYNNGDKAFIVMGYKGTEWYENQPVEKDAFAIAGQFVQETNSCLQQEANAAN